MSGELSSEQLRSYFDQDVRPYLDEQRPQASSGRSGSPVLVFTGGQPGAGKSRANERAAQARPSLVAVIGDDLRQFHPDYVQLMQDDPLAMPEMTAQASGRWIGMSADYLREQRADVLIETTLRSPDAMARTISGFREAGYAVELRVVAVPEEVSRLSTVERYTGQVAATGAGRWTPSAAHDEAYARAAGTVEGLVSSGAVDRVVLEDRAGRVVFESNYFGSSDSELKAAGMTAAAALEHARGIDQMVPETARSWIGLAKEQIESVRGLGQQDEDLSATIERIGTIDANAVAARAFPHESARADSAAESLSVAAREAVRSTKQSTTSAERPTVPASFPQAVAQATIQRPQTGKLSGPRAVYRGSNAPGRGSDTGPAK
ncbi:MAG: zeta toxin family protein [Dermabacter sp.]|nr:zeta toxin family protein [Dermabacter sp.]